MPLPIVGSAHAEPHAGEFIWFMYSSSLSRGAFAAWAERHRYPLPDLAKAVPARLDGYRLSFDVESGFWGGAVASLTPSPGQFVEGAALRLSGGERVLVDHKEGALSGLYEAFDVQVAPLAGGVTLTALAYRAAPSRRLSAEGRPSRSFVEALQQGAKDFGLSADYQARLAAL